MFDFLLEPSIGGTGDGYLEIIYKLVKKYMRNNYSDSLRYKNIMAQEIRTFIFT
jgi:hypothetical protein